MKIDVQNCSSSNTVPKAPLLKKWVKTALELEQKTMSVCIRVVDEEESQQLNTQYRNKAKPTNVLSFSATGDLAVCAPVVEREAKSYNLPLLDHWAHIIVHGTLHLLEYDHENKKDARIMEAREIAILKHLGFSNPY